MKHTLSALSLVLLAGCNDGSTELGRLNGKSLAPYAPAVSASSFTIPSTSTSGRPILAIRVALDNSPSPEAFLIKGVPSCEIGVDVAPVGTNAAAIRRIDCPAEAGSTATSLSIPARETTPLIRTIAASVLDRFSSGDYDVWATITTETGTMIKVSAGIIHLPLP